MTEKELANAKISMLPIFMPANAVTMRKTMAGAFWFTKPATTASPNGTHNQIAGSNVINNPRTRHKRCY